MPQEKQGNAAMPSYDEGALYNGIGLVDNEIDDEDVDEIIDMMNNSIESIEAISAAITEAQGKAGKFQNRLKDYGETLNELYPPNFWRGK